MYIEICQDVIDDAISRSGQRVNDSLDLLQLFALFSIQGRHIIVVPSLRFNSVLIKKLGDVMTPNSVEKLRCNEKIYYMLPTIKASLAVYCLVSYSSNNQGDDRAIVLNPSKLMKFEPYLETRLITENVLDSKFYRYIGQFFARKNLLQSIVLRFDVKPGGGSTTGEVVREELINPKRFCLVVVDSDKKYPKQPKYGSTAQKVIDIFSKYPCRTCLLYIIEDVMEIENLIPHRIVRQYASEKSSCDILDKDSSFFDMKVGIRLHDLYDEDVFNFWRPLMIEEGFDFSRREEAVNSSKCKSDYERYIVKHDIEDVFKRGFGSDLLMIVTCSPDKDDRIRYPEIEHEMLNNITSHDLTTIQLSEWERLGKLIFSYTCGLKVRSV